LLKSTVVQALTATIIAKVEKIEGSIDELNDLFAYKLESSLSGGEVQFYALIQVRKKS